MTEDNVGRLVDSLTGDRIPTTKVGGRALSILEIMLRDYVHAHTRNGRYEGNPEYLQRYDSLCEYNRTNGYFTDEKTGGHTNEQTRNKDSE